MTVENWLRGQFQGIGTQIEMPVLEAAALSPIFAKPEPFVAVDLDENVESHKDDKAFMDGLLYALSSLYYAMSASITGGTRSEKRGNRSVSIGGYPLTTKDREAFRKMGDALRTDLGAELEEEAQETGGMFDAGYLRGKSIQS